MPMGTCAKCLPIWDLLCSPLRVRRDCLGLLAGTLALARALNHGAQLSLKATFDHLVSGSQLNKLVFRPSFIRVAGCGL